MIGVNIYLFTNRATLGNLGWSESGTLNQIFPRNPVLSLKVKSNDSDPRSASADTRCQSVVNKERANPPTVARERRTAPAPALRFAICHVIPKKPRLTAVSIG